jgi:hypothetical protein
MFYCHKDAYFKSSDSFEIPKFILLQVQEEWKGGGAIALQGYN